MDGSSGITGSRELYHQYKVGMDGSSGITGSRELYHQYKVGVDSSLVNGSPIRLGRLSYISLCSKDVDCQTYGGSNDFNSVSKP